MGYSVKRLYGQNMNMSPLSAVEHYRTFLAEHYTWMSGPYAEKIAHQHELLVRSGVVPLTTGEALDLGCGPGSQSIALAQLGFSVTAIDANAQLLEELSQRATGMPILTVQHDLCVLATCPALPAQVDVAVCVGDIIPHLPTAECITTLFQQVSARLVPHGKFVLSFRDLSEERYGLDRFLPIRSDSDRIMMCFLEFEPNTVVVHDLIYIRQGERWDLRKSSYRKLRLSLARVLSQLETEGLAVLFKEQAGGVWNVVASKR
jgi:2-polyprenyl-3-methyl-5-hydroxy-6-metoxy-1,4-benzoquinol methylase